MLGLYSVASVHYVAVYRTVCLSLSVVRAKLLMSYEVSLGGSNLNLDDQA